MVKKYSDLYLQARRALLPSEGENASMAARELLAFASGKSVTAVLADSNLYASEQIEEKLHISQRNKELIELLELEKSLVYFTTSLRSNETVLEKLLRTEKIKKYPEDEDLLEDVIVENKQAIEMAKIYSDILSGTMDAFASVISNNLNVVMKFLSTVTIVLSIPTMIASFYGMNFQHIPLGDNPYGFYIVTAITLIVTVVLVFFFKKKNLF